MSTHSSKPRACSRKASGNKSCSGAISACAARRAARTVSDWLAIFAAMMAARIASELPQLAFHMAGGAVRSDPGLFEQVRSQARRVANVTFHGALPYGETSAH